MEERVVGSRGRERVRQTKHDSHRSVRRSDRAIKSSLEPLLTLLDNWCLEREMFPILLLQLRDPDYRVCKERLQLWPSGRECLFLHRMKFEGDLCKLLLPIPYPIITQTPHYVLEGNSGGKGIGASGSGLIL